LETFVLVADESRPSLSTQAGTLRSSAGSDSKKFFTGQWLDVKDTVSQWLEATVLEVNENEGTVFVHYNGW
jgi:hypothetical protein